MHFLDLTLPTVAANLALDEALLIEADAGRGRPLVRLWDPPEFAVVLGASRRLADDVFADACASDQVPILRRSSGGGTVLVGPGVLCVTVILPDDAAPGLSRVDLAHSYVLERIAAALRSAAPRCKWKCSAAATSSRAGRKFGGSAQRRLKSWFMVHCSILYRFPDRAHRPIPQNAVAASPNIVPAGPTRDFLANLALPRATARRRHPQRIFCRHGRLSRYLPCPPRSSNPSSSEKFANRQWIERF